MPKRNQYFTLPETIDPLGAQMRQAQGLPILPVPDIIEFVVSDKYLNKPQLYPRQATLLKIVFLQDTIFTDFDYRVIEEWANGFSLNTGDPEVWRYEGYHGVQPDILKRIDMCKAMGRRWFRECVVAIGRRGAKGYLGGLCGAYVLWNYLAWGNPQEHFGVASTKVLSCMVFGGKLELAKANQWKDISDVILTAPCFTPYVSKPQTDKLTVYAPNDAARIQDRLRRGIPIDTDMASFEIVAKEATVMAGRGPTSFCLDPTTPVLTANLEWRPIGSIRVGDELIGLDEYPVDGKHRKMQNTTVQAVWHTYKPAIRLRFTDGSSVVCSGDHRWLVGTMGANGNAQWRAARWIDIGHRVKRVVDPWEDDRSYEGGYLAGVFDGEACVVTREGRPTGALQFSQNPGAVMDTTLRLLKEKGYNPKSVSRKAFCQHVQLSGLANVMRFLGSVRPYRLLNRDIWQGHALRSCGFKTVIGIDELPEQELIDIETGTRTFVANGLVSHNSQFYDEMAHVSKSTARASADELYGTATPALDQFKGSEFIWEGSSTWEMIGKFYENWGYALQVTARTKEPIYPETMMVQLESWDPYKDWERATTIPMRGGYQRTFAPLKKAIQTYDKAMERLERANPETFAVERRSRWRATEGAYLNPERIAQMWVPFNGRDSDTWKFQTRGAFNINYVGHCDPSKSNANFALAIGHVEGPFEDGFLHVVFDLLKHWEPGDFPDNLFQIDYIEIEKFLEKYVLDAYKPDELTFDQFNSVGTIQRLNRYVRQSQYHKKVTVYERTATKDINWTMAETFKTALNMQLIHSPFYEQATKELLFLQDKGNKKVEHPTEGPVQTDDLYDAMANVVYSLIGDQMSAFLATQLGNFPLTGATQGGAVPFAGQFVDSEMNEYASQFRQFGSGRRAMERASMGAPGRRMETRRSSASRRWNPSTPWNSGGGPR
jgi:hypothetical protein